MQIRQLLAAWLASSLIGIVVGAPFAYVPNLLSGDITVIDIAHNTVVTTIPNIGSGPRFVAANPRTARAYVRAGPGSS